MLLIALLACGRGCPARFAADPARAARIAELAGQEGPMCFGDVPELGVLGSDRVLLDVDADDAVLAARVVHLAHHRTPDGGPDCRARLLREEATAWLAEHAHREALGVEAPVLPPSVAPTRSAVEAWLLARADATSRQLAESHARRCRTGYPPP